MMENAGKPIKKKNRKILFQTGAVIILLFALTTFAISNIVTISAFSSLLTSARLEQSGYMKIAFNLMKEYHSLPWLMDYWAENGKNMTFREDTASYTDEISRILARLEKEDADDITLRDIEQLTEEEQELFACACYMAFNDLFVMFGEDYNMKELSLLIPDADSKKMLIIFDNSVQGSDQLLLGETRDIKEMEHENNALASAMMGDANWAVRPPSRDGRFGFGLDFSYGSNENPVIIWSTIRGGQIYDSMIFNEDIREGVIFFLIMIGLLILVYLYVIVIRPLSRVKNCVREYRESKDAEKVAQQLAGIRSRNEIGVFADEFSSLAQEIERYTTEVAALAGEKERVETELGVAARIQADMLPGVFPERREFALYAVMDPAREVGGDFYDFYMIDEDHLALTIADVTGKGVPASLFMAVSKTILKNRTLEGGTPAQILEAANNQICEGNDNSMFVTVWLGILTISTGEMVCANGGHEYPGLRQKGEPFRLVRTKHGLALGVMEDMTYLDEHYQLSPGDSLFVYTDGVTEANRTDGSMFGETRLEQVLAGTKADDTPAMILEEVRSAVDDFVGDAPQFDDLTMLCVVYHGQ